MNYKTSKKDYKLFKTYCKKWIDFWGLYEWETNYVHYANEDARASIWWEMTGMIATIGLGKVWADPEPYELSKVAFHEVCEIMLCPVTQLALDEYAKRKVDNRIHTIIRRLENIIFESFKDKSDIGYM